MDEITVVADTRLEEAIVYVVFKIHRFTIGRIFVSGAMQIGNTCHILGEDCRKTNGHSICLHLRQCVMANMEIPQSVQDALSAQWGPSSKDLSKHLRLVSRNGFIS